MSVEAEVIIRDWIDSKCDPSPRSLEKVMERVTFKLNVVGDAIREAFGHALPDWGDCDEKEWELAK